MTYQAPTRQRGTTVLNVRDPVRDADVPAAIGDGVTDDTAAFNACIAELPDDGGTVLVPGGTYLIDPLVSIQLRSLMHLELAIDATLLAKPNASDNYNVILGDLVHDVEVSGGQIIGDRAQHVGTTGEGGHGIRIRGSRAITLRDLCISDCWGDGLCVGPNKDLRTYVYSEDVAISGVTVDAARRNGLSIGNVVGVYVYNCIFSNTNGTKPQCGIDVEPDTDGSGVGYAQDVTIDSCALRGNAMYGLNQWKDARNLVITNCIIEGNQVCGVVTKGIRSGAITGNTFRNNQSTGLFIQDGSANVEVAGNTFSLNYMKQGPVLRKTPLIGVGLQATTRRDLIVSATAAGIKVGSNAFE